MTRLGIMAAVVLLLCAQNKGRAGNCDRRVLSFNAPLSLSVAALGGGPVFFQPALVEPLEIRSYAIPLQRSLRLQRTAVQQRPVRVGVVRRRFVLRIPRRRGVRLRTRIIVQQ